MSAQKSVELLKQAAKTGTGFAIAFTTGEGAVPTLIAQQRRSWIMKSRMWKNGLVVLVISLISVLSLTACETTKGVGQDIENAGEEMDDAID
jgi:entericidin B